MVLSHMPVYYCDEDFRMWSGKNCDGVISLSGPDSFQDGQMFAGVDVLPLILPAAACPQLLNKNWPVTVSVTMLCVIQHTVWSAQK